MTNSQRFGGRLLHFWPLSTMNWPEACIARAGQMHVHGDKTHRYIHTHTHAKQAPTQKHAHARTQQRQIRLHYRKGRSWNAGYYLSEHAGRRNALLEHFTYLTLYKPYMIKQKHSHREAIKNQSSKSNTNVICSCSSNKNCCVKKVNVPVFTEVAALFGS